MTALVGCREAARALRRGAKEAFEAQLEAAHQQWAQQQKNQAESSNEEMLRAEVDRQRTAMASLADAVAAANMSVKEQQSLIDDLEGQLRAANDKVTSLAAKSARDEQGSIGDLEAQLKAAHNRVATLSAIIEAKSNEYLQQQEHRCPLMRSHAPLCPLQHHEHGCG